MTDATAPRQKLDRDEVFLEYTKSICPVCKAVVDAEVNVRDDRVYLRKRCRDHGRFEALLYSDAAMYLDSMRFNKPGTIPLETQTEVRDGCPLDCGLCPEHKQHACLGIIEVNTGCNLDCPVCFADSGHQDDGFSLTLEQVEAGLEAFVRAEGEPEVVMFSGGEPPPEALKTLTDTAFMVVIQDFQDPYTLNVKSLMKCCVEEITPDGRLIPFCAYNSVGYREQVRAALSGVDVEPVVPNATTLQPVLLTTRHGSRTVAGTDPRPGDLTNVGRTVR